MLGLVEEKDSNLISQDDRFKIYGLQNESQIKEVIDCCDIGLSCLALDRKGMTDACPLKVREYLAYGLPVYMGHTDSAFPDKFKYIYRGGVDINEILSFARRARSFLAEEVKEASRVYISKDQLLLNLHKQLYAALFADHH